MPSGVAIQARIEKALAQVQATERPVAIRTVAPIMGDDVLRIGYTADVVDRPVVPPPAVRQVTAAEIQTSGGLLQPGDYRFIFGGSVDRDTLKHGQLLYGDDVLQIVRIDPSVYQGIAVAVRVIARTQYLEEAPVRT